MYTHCPHCDTYFRITSTQLKSAQGEVRCGRCFGTFNALQQLVDEPPTRADSSDSPSAEAITPEPSAVEVAEKTEPTTTISQEAPTEKIEPVHSQQLFDELQQPDSTEESGKRLLWGVASIPLLLLMAIQYGYFNLQQLSQQSQYRPALELLCSITGCEVPLLKAPRQIKLSQRDIRAHESKKHVLVVKATIHNQAEFTQPFPLLQLSMQDITGHTMTGRRFLPTEYLADQSINLTQGIAPNQRQQILLELVDPGEEAVGFEFEFL